MPTFAHRLEPAPLRAAAHGAARIARRAFVLLALIGAGTATAQTCVTSWQEYELKAVDARFGPTPWSDPTSGGFHTHHHGTLGNSRLGAASFPTSYFEYFRTMLIAVYDTFGEELSYLAEQRGLANRDELWITMGMSALDAFVNFDDPIEIGYDESGTYCANLYSITDGSHEGEFLLIVRDPKTNWIKHWEVVPTEDVGRARAHEVMAELDKVMLDPDGCGDMRVGEGC